MPLLLVALLVLIADPVAAQTPRSGRLEELKQLSIEELVDTDVTTASRRIERLADVAAAVTVITGEDLRRRHAGQDGYTLIALLADRLGAGMPRATIALTAYASRADRERAIAAGFREHLAKPVNPDVLLQTLEDLLAEDATRAV